MDDLVKRLRGKRERFHDLSGVYWSEDMLCQEAADRIEADAKRIAALERENEELDFLRHEGGPDSVAALEAKAARADAAEARVKVLEEALRQISEDAYVTVNTKKNGGVSWRKMYQGWKRIACDRIDIARAALEGEKT